MRRFVSIFYLLCVLTGDVFASPKILEVEANAKTWFATSKVTLGKQETAYKCKFMKSPPVEKKSNIIGFGEFQGINKKHAHHIDIYQCIPPVGKRADMFEKYIQNEEGFDCDDSSVYIPKEYCQFYLEWACCLYKLYPDNMATSFNSNEYYMMVTHFNNPKMQEIQVESGFELYYTDAAREHDSGYLLLGQQIGFTHVIPPESENFVIPRHCSSECTQRLQHEINIFNVAIHAHESATQIRIKQFREGKELPNIIFDQNFTPKGDQNLLDGEVKVLPGDQITIECTYTTTGKDGKVTMGGKSANDEMCIAFLRYYPRSHDLAQCGSSLNEKTLLDFIGVSDIVKVAGDTNPMVISPMELNGLKLNQVLENIEWTEEQRVEFQNMMKTSTLQESYCLPTKQ